MYVKYHSAGVISHYCIRMCCAVIQNLDNTCIRVLGRSGLGGGQSVEGDQQRVVHCSRIIQQDAENLLGV